MLVLCEFPFAVIDNLILINSVSFERSSDNVDAKTAVYKTRYIYSWRSCLPL